MKVVYPACFYPNEEQPGYTVVFPDLPGCTTFGSDLTEALEMAEDAASGWILSSLEDGEEVPPASKKEDTTAEQFPGGFVNLIFLDIGAYAKLYGENAIKKTLTIPVYLNTLAEKYNINFSQVLQESLKEKISMKQMK